MRSPQAYPGMFSVPDILVVSVLALLLFGPDRLPKVMRQAGRFMRDVQSTSHAFVAEMERAADVSAPVPPAPHVPSPRDESTPPTGTSQPGNANRDADARGAGAGSPREP
jgi:TatA/E family protein of Tat protein translocase